MTIWDAIPIVLEGYGNACETAYDFHNFLLEKARGMASEYPNHTRVQMHAVGIVLGAQEISSSMFGAQTEGYYRKHCQSPAPEWVGVETPKDDMPALLGQQCCVDWMGKAGEPCKEIGLRLCQAEGEVHIRVTPCLVPTYDDEKGYALAHLSLKFEQRGGDA